MNNNKLTREQIELIIKECRDRKEEEKNKSRKLKPLSEKDKEQIWRALSWE